MSAFHPSRSRSCHSAFDPLRTFQSRRLAASTGYQMTTKVMPAANKTVACSNVPPGLSSQPVGWCDATTGFERKLGIGSLRIILTAIRVHIQPKPYVNASPGNVPFVHGASRTQINAAQKAKGIAHDKMPTHLGMSKLASCDFGWSSDIRYHYPVNANV